MKKEELEDLGSKIESEAAKDSALFEFHYHDGYEDAIYIKANRDGLLLFAMELLKVSATISQSGSEPVEKTISFDDSGMMEYSQVSILYIEPTLQKKQKTIKALTHKKTWKDSFAQIGCIGVVIIFALSAIVGFISILRWLF